MPAPAPHDLAYAPPPPVHRRTWVRRVLAIATSLLTVAILASLAPYAVHRARLVYLQRQAMAYVPPPGTIVYEDGAATSAQPHAWRTMLGRIDVSRSSSLATPFAGAVRSPAGHVRFVGIELYRTGYAPLFIAGRVVEPGTLLSPPRTVAYTTGNACVAYRTPEHVRVYAGRVDPNDPSHFSIAFEIEGKRGWVDMWLTDDDQVVFARREAPSTSAPTQP